MKYIIAIFWNRHQHRLRAVWRIALQLALMALLVGLSQLPLFGLSLLAPDLVDGDVQMLLSLLTIFLAILASVALAGRFLDRRPFRDFGFHFSPAWWADFGFGLALGAALMVFIFLTELAAGWVTLAGFFAEGGDSFAAALFSPILLFICVGIQEELTTRGYLLRNVAEGLHTARIPPRAAVISAYLASSVFFGLLHAANPNASAISTLNLVFAGLFLGLPYVLTGELSISIGLHMAWNFFQGNVFGFPVSGTFSGPTIIAIQQSGPQWVTGGAFGPEAGFIGLAAIALGCLAILARLRGRGLPSLREQLAVYQPATLPPEPAEASLQK